jgi:hypothetical protein
MRQVMPFPTHTRELPALRNKQRDKESESLDLSKNVENGMSVVLGALEFFYSIHNSTVHIC